MSDDDDMMPTDVSYAGLLALTIIVCAATLGVAWIVQVFT